MHAGGASMDGAHACPCWNASVIRRRHHCTLLQGLPGTRRYTDQHAPGSVSVRTQKQKTGEEDQDKRETQGCQASCKRRLAAHREEWRADLQELQYGQVPRPQTTGRDSLRQKTHMCHLSERQLQSCRSQVGLRVWGDREPTSWHLESSSNCKYSRSTYNNYTTQRADDGRY